MKQYIIILVMILFAISSKVSASNQINSISKPEVIINCDSLLIEGMTFNEFVPFYAGKNQSNERYPKISIERFIANFKTEIEKACDKFKKNDLTLQYNFHTITEFGGFSGKYFVKYKGDLIDADSFSQEDGRWNKLDILLVENLHKFIKHHKFDLDRIIQVLISSINHKDGSYNLSKITKKNKRRKGYEKDLKLDPIYY